MTLQLTLDLTPLKKKQKNSQMIKYLYMKKKLLVKKIKPCVYRPTHSDKISKHELYRYCILLYFKYSPHTLHHIRSCICYTDYLIKCNLFKMNIFS